MTLDQDFYPNTISAAPVFEVKPQSVVTSDPLQVNLLCIAKGSPTPDITWYYDGEKITDIVSCNFVLYFRCEQSLDFRSGEFGI